MDEKKFLKSLRKAGRNEIIEAVLEYHTDQLPDGFDAAQFERTTVKRRKGELVVSFDFPARYLPLGTSYRFDYSIHLGSIFSRGSGIVSNIPEGQQRPDEVDFWVPREGDRKVIDFVLEAADRNPISPGTHHTIYEKDSHYEIRVETGNTSGWYSVEKETGRVFDEGHKHRAISKKDRWETVRD